LPDQRFRRRVEERFLKRPFAARGARFARRRAAVFVFLFRVRFFLMGSSLFYMNFARFAV
jgi:hypothetical protein